MDDKDKRRKPISAETLTRVLRESRRRCCICFGLRRDDEVKKGQIAHLDQDRNNNSFDNLAWLCLEHHDEYDSRTSQSKSIQIHEVKAYRRELYATFAHWSSVATTQHFLNFLASTISIDMMLDAAIRAASRYRILPEDLVYEALVETSYESWDGDNWGPYLSLVEDFESWGWLTFTLRENRTDTTWYVHIEVTHRPVCIELRKAFEKRFPEKIMDVRKDS